MIYPVLRGGKHCLAETHPEYVDCLVDSSVAYKVHAGSTIKVAWWCEAGHAYTSPVRNVVQFHHGCNICAGKVVVAGINDVLTVHPEAVDEVVDIDTARKLASGSNKKIDWRCRVCGHVWQASPNSRFGKNSSGCPVCAGKVVVAGINDLATVEPSVAAELVDRSLATQLTRTSNKRVLWRCANGHEWCASVASRTAQGTGCPYCSGRCAIEGETDLATTHPELAVELVDKSLAHVVSAGSKRKVEWECKKGHRWTSAIQQRAIFGSGCPYCSGHIAVPGETDLATLRPDLAAELVDSTLAACLTLSSNKKVRWRCEHGHEWDAVVSSRTGTEACGCPYCSGRYAIEGKTDLATTHPDIATELVDSSLATSLTYGSRREVEWRCDNGHVYVMSPKSHICDGTGCPFCSNTGVSEKEKSLVATVRALVGDAVEVLENDRSILGNRLELDVAVPLHHVAFEFNGLWWHSEAAGRSNMYHRDKMRAAKAAGYSLFMVWEDDWDRRRGVVVRMLAAKLGATARLREVLPDIDHKACERVFARKLEVCVVKGAEAHAFLEANHIQGAVSATLHVGLRDADGDLRALLSLRSPSANARMKREVGTWEIQRYATCGIVPGGFSRLLAHAKDLLIEHGEDVRRWVSFSANDVSEGGLYLTCGFTRASELKPDYRYVGHITGWVRKPKERFQKRHFRERDDLVFDESWTETQAARENRLWRVFDAGKIRWERDA